jgi:predicted RNase H-like nuclease
MIKEERPMKHKHKPYAKLSFKCVEGCKCGHYRVARDGSFEFSEWKLHFFRGKGPFREFLKRNNDARCGGDHE